MSALFVAVAFIAGLVTVACLAAWLVHRGDLVIQARRKPAPRTPAAPKENQS